VGRLAAHPAATPPRGALHEDVYVRPDEAPVDLRRDRLLERDQTLEPAALLVLGNGVAPLPGAGPLAGGVLEEERRIVANPFEERLGGGEVCLALAREPDDHVRRQRDARDARADPADEVLVLG